MLPELSEDEARGEIREIYARIRTTTQVPYVSSLQRHLATRSGWLEWAWSLVGDGFMSGQIPNRVWERADSLDVPGMAPISPAAMRSFGVDAAGVEQIRNVLSSFIRVSPTNLGFSGCVRRVLLDDVQVAPPVLIDGVTDVPALDPLPPLVDMAALPAHEQAVLMQMGTRVDGSDFVPGLYRMLAHWPAYFAHAATCIEPLRDRADTACHELAGRINDVVPEFLHGVSPSPSPCHGDDAMTRRVVDAIDRYRQTSPQMVVYCRMLRDALPAAS